MPACCSYRKSSCKRMDDLSISSAAFQSQNDNSLFTLIVPIFTWEILDTPLNALDLWREFVGQTEARSNRRFRGPNETIGLLRMILMSFMSINLAYRLATDGSDRPRIILQRNRVTQFSKKLSAFGVLTPQSRVANRPASQFRPDHHLTGFVTASIYTPPVIEKIEIKPSQNETRIYPTTPFTNSRKRFCSPAFSA
jgi:hypothetical protein